MAIKDIIRRGFSAAVTLVTTRGYGIAVDTSPQPYTTTSTGSLLAYTSTGSLTAYTSVGSVLND